MLVRWYACRLQSKIGSLQERHDKVLVVRPFQSQKQQTVRQSPAGHNQEIKCRQTIYAKQLIFWAPGCSTHVRLICAHTVRLVPSVISAHGGGTHAAIVTATRVALYRRLAARLLAWHVSSEQIGPNELPQCLHSLLNLKLALRVQQGRPATSTVRVSPGVSEQKLAVLFRLITHSLPANGSQACAACACKHMATIPDE